MLKQLLAGAAAGVIATIPQSAVVWGARSLGVYRRTAAPEAVAERLTNRVTELEQLPRRWRPMVKLIEHFAFGAAVGAAFGAVAGRLRPRVVAGLVVGLAVWKLSYDGWIPRLGILPPPERDEPGRARTMIAAHVAYGLALGLAYDRLDRPSR